MLKHTSTMPISSWRARHLQHKDVLNSGVPEGQYPKVGHRFLDEIYMGYCNEKNQQVESVSEHFNG